MSTKSRIKKLPKDVINKIAAGEVVERPASIVKELIENSIDAKSDQITVRVENAGTTLIQVADNGIGMNRQEATLAFQQHTTSKIANVEDLSNINTLGFRGEALASIASVAQIELLTNNREESTKVTIKNQKIEVSEGSFKPGTLIKVKNLFYNIPVRKKFLRSFNTEFKHIQDTFIKAAIANPAIHFSLYSNNKIIFNLPKATDLKTRINDIWPNKFTDNFIEFDFKLALFNISGVLIHPNLASRTGRKWQFININKRPVKSDLISKAIKDAYHSTIYKEFYPMFFININLDPKLVDINIHPRKEEVKFANTQGIYSGVKQATGKALEQFLQSSVKQQFNLSKNNTKENYTQKNQNKYTIKTSKITFRDTNKMTYKRQTPHKEVEESIMFSKNLLSSSHSKNLQPKEQTELTNKLNLNDFHFIQVFKTFIIIEKDSKLFIIDQHAADERVNYEKIMTKLKTNKQISTQQLLIPQTIELQPAQYSIILSLKDKLKEIGLEIEPFGKNTIKLTAKPSIFKNFNFENFIHEILQKDIPDINKEEILHLIVATMACHGSIRAGQTLHKEEVKALITNLFSCQKPHSCPHGRPIIWELTKHDIEKNFKRTGFC